MKKIVLFLLIGIALNAQTPDPKKIVNEVQAKFAKVKDYSANASIKIEIPFFKMPDRNIKIYFKLPNKTHIESEGFSILPKMGLNFNPTELLKDDFVPAYIKQDKIDGRAVDVINLMPKSDTAKVKYIKLWIDSSEKVIRKFEVASERGGGSVTADLFYGNEIYCGLPWQIKFSMDFGMVRMPSEIGRPKKNEAEKKDNKDNKGNVTVTYSNYLINKGIDDKIFIEKKK